MNLARMEIRKDRLPLPPPPPLLPLFRRSSNPFGDARLFLCPTPVHAGHHIFHNLSLVSHASSVTGQYLSVIPHHQPPPHPHLLRCFGEIELTAEPRYKKSVKSQNKLFAITWVLFYYILPQVG